MAPYTFGNEPVRPSNALTQPDTSTSTYGHQSLMRIQTQSNTRHNFPNNTTYSLSNNGIRMSGHHDYGNVPPKNNFPAAEKRSGQKRISQYFADVKDIDNRHLPEGKGQKRSLDDLKHKYDTAFNIVPNSSSKL